MFWFVYYTSGLLWGCYVMLVCSAICGVVRGVFVVCMFSWVELVGSIILWFCC